MSGGLSNDPEFPKRSPSGEIARAAADGEDLKTVCGFVGLRPLALEHLRDLHRELSAEERLRLAFNTHPRAIVLSSSFGAQAAVLLHLFASQELQDRAPVIFIDTQDHFPETLEYAETLRRMFSLDLRVYRAHQSIEEQHQEWGAYWEQGADGMKRHNRVNKVEPFSRALSELDAHAWVTGARRAQSESRSAMEPIETRGDLLKYNVLYDWSDAQISDYMLTHKLPPHPLLAQGYTTIGDRHSTRRSSEVDSADSARNLGYGRECGLQCEIKR